ncbi:MAG: hypothetical protein R3Y24_15565 [Eubacteriales bacterium]
MGKQIVFFMFFYKNKSDDLCNIFLIIVMAKSVLHKNSKIPTSKKCQFTGFLEEIEKKEKNFKKSVDTSNPF